MWISEPMPVTTRIISADSGSTRSEKGTNRSTDAIHVKTRCSTARSPWSAGASSICMTTAIETPKAATITPDAIAPDTPLDRRLPKKALIRKPRNGSPGISSSNASPLERGIGVRIERLPMPEERNHDGETDRGLRGRHGHDEERDDLPVDASLIAAQRHERQVHRVEHHLDREHHGDQVAAQEHAGRADREEHAREQQVVIQCRHYCPAPFSRGGCLRARMTAPTIATRISSDVAS